MAPTWPITIPVGVPAATTRKAVMTPKQTTRPAPIVQIRKAKTDEAAAPIPVYNAKKQLVGIIRDPEKLTRVADTSGTNVDLTPAPAGEVGIAAGDVAKLRKSMHAGTTRDERDAAAELLDAVARAKFRQIHRHPRNGR